MQTTTKSTRSTATSTQTMDAIKFLTTDHAAVRALLTKLAETTDRAPKKRLDILETLAVQVRAHARIEEEIFYPAYKAAAKSKEEAKLYFEATEEHGLVDVVLPVLESTDPQDETFGAKAKVLKDLIEHHAEEEETEMFPKAKKLLGKERLLELGERMAARKEELVAEASPPARRNGTRKDAPSAKPSSIAARPTPSGKGPLAPQSARMSDADDR